MMRILLALAVVCCASIASSAQPKIDGLPETLYWADYLFEQKAKRPGHWVYEIDYRGRGGSLDKWEVNYNPIKEQFEGQVTRITDEP